jgi:transcriptional regulator with XRE-family HTH domain
MPVRSQKRLSARLRPSYVEFGRFLRSAREDSGLTQAALASKLRVPQSWISKVEAGDRRTDVLELLDLLDALGVDPADFLRSLCTKRKPKRR